MAQTSTPAPLDDSRLWRRAPSRVHPDSGGDHEIFLFLSAAKEALAEPCECRRGDPLAGPRNGYAGQEQTTDRIDYDPELGIPSTFDALTMRALESGVELEEPYRKLISLLTDCVSSGHGRQELKQRRGASFKQLAYAGYLAGLNKEERGRFYEIAQRVPLSDRHISHVIDKLKDGRK